MWCNIAVLYQVPIYNDYVMSFSDRFVNFYSLNFNISVSVCVKFCGFYRLLLLK